MKFINWNYFFIVVLLFFSCKNNQNSENPNVIFILTDDLGFAFDSYGSTMIKTPNLDLMASQGALLNSYYSTQAVCSASRASILAGVYPNRIGFSGALGPNSKKGIHPNEFLMSEMFKQNIIVLQFMGNGIWEIILNFYLLITGLMIFMESCIQMICGHIMQNILKATPT